MARTSNIEGDAPPRPGSFSFCMKCAHLYVFDDRMDLVEPSAEHLAAIKADRELADYLWHIRIAILAARGKIVLIAVNTRGGFN